MKNWDDIRYFLAIAKSGSVRSAAEVLDVNHSTVLRRVLHLEKQLGVRLFEKLPSGYELTQAGHEVLQIAEEMDQNASSFEHRIYERDRGLAGKLSVTLPAVLATHLIMPDLASFTRRCADIDLDINTSYAALNLTNRNADVAIRLMHDQNDIPGHLYGTKLCGLYRGVYVSRELSTSLSAGKPVSSLRWILKSEDGAVPPWAISGDLAGVGRALTVSDLATQICATQQGMGASVLPCFIGDADEGLARMPGIVPELYGYLWLLTHGETKNIPRVRAFVDFMRTTFESYRRLLVGEPEDMLK